MEFPRTPDPHPAFLPAGTLVGPWRVVSRRGRGAYGVVYRAVRADQGEAGPVALKIAIMEQDPRYAREVELLTRIQHPGVPRAVDQGCWQSPAGCVYPYLVLEWVEGISLYEWAASREPSSHQVLRLLAQAARALEAIHAVGGLHRDIKGDHVLVRSDGAPVALTGLGTGHRPDVGALTRWPLPPGTPAYRSPEAWLLSRRSGHYQVIHDGSMPEDDLFALGVTAYRLVTGQYPPPTDPSLDGAEAWHEEGVGPRPPRELNPRVAPRLDALILRMLSVEPEARGSARELAEALEEAAESESPRACSQPEPVPRPSPALEPDGKRWLWLALMGAAMGLSLLMKAPPVEPEPFEPAEPLEDSWSVSAGQERGDDGDGGVEDRGAGTLASVVAIDEPVRSSSVYGVEFPKSPWPGQRRPPCAGAVEIQGGCWLKHEARPPDCPDFAYAWGAGCYVPIFSNPRPTTSDP